MIFHQVYLHTTPFREKKKLDSNSVIVYFDDNDPGYWCLIIMDSFVFRHIELIGYFGDNQFAYVYKWSFDKIKLGHDNCLYNGVMVLEIDFEFFFFFRSSVYNIWAQLIKAKIMMLKLWLF